MPSAKPGYQRDFLTPAGSFYEVTRGKPYLLDDEARKKAGLTPETWRLEVVPDEPPWKPTLARTFRKDDGTALTLGDLEALFRERPVRCIKTMQCLMDSPSGGLCSNGLWEGVALRDVLARLGRLKDVRRVFYTGFFEDPKHRFASSLSLSEVLETPPGHTPVFLALRLNGRPLPIERGGPVRMLVPEGYGFKSIKWLNRVVLTNDYRANDTYAERQNNDPSSPMKTLARLDIHAPQVYRQGEPVTHPGRGDGRGVGPEAGGILAVQGPGDARRPRPRRPGLGDRRVEGGHLARRASGRLGIGPARRPVPRGRGAPRPGDGEAAGVAAAVQLGGVGGEAGGAGGVELRVPGAGGGPQRVRPAGAPPEPAVGHRRGAVHDVHRRLMKLPASSIDEGSSFSMAIPVAASSPGTGQAAIRPPTPEPPSVFFVSCDAPDSGPSNLPMLTRSSTE